VEAGVIEQGESAYLWADGIYERGIGKEKAASLVVIGVMRNGQMRFLALEAGYRERKESWAVVPRQLRAPGGVISALLFVAIGALL
jgi:hypothetical protein